NKIILDPLTFSEARFRPSLEERLESIISGAALMADSSCTRDDRRERIVAECNAVRQALQDLLSEYMNNPGLQCTKEDLGSWLAELNLTLSGTWHSGGHTAFKEDGCLCSSALQGATQKDLIKRQGLRTLHQPNSAATSRMTRSLCNPKDYLRRTADIRVIEKEIETMGWID
ncbi:hypothetical protein QQF64_000802, partial [Cirrhinus molitorella]